MSQPLAVKTENLGRIYKIRNNRKEKQRELLALENVNLEIREGELFGLLGPNGAGKTTLIKILTTLLSPTSGQAWVAGFDVTKQPAEVRKRINMVSGGETSGYGLLTVRENLWMFAQFYGIPSPEANRRIQKTGRDRWHCRPAQHQILRSFHRLAPEDEYHPRFSDGSRSAFPR